ncbi:hypothetical protein FQA39_LY14336 [Lamprigera yunnana]|nr:hypothetical protein FQA39_LY14336 [Lamprigera yunnana]
MHAALNVCLVLLGFFCQKNDGMCINVLSNEEQECAGPLNLKAFKILRLYDMDSDDDNFKDYVSCVWLKWNYVDGAGRIQYKNLRESQELLWNINRNDGYCVIDLSNVEQECADRLYLNASKIFHFYQLDSGDDRFIDYLNCVWVKWNYVEGDGRISFKNLRESKELLWNIDRNNGLCIDVLSNVELECGSRHHLGESKIFRLYNKDSDDDKFKNYLSCVWLKWNYVDGDGRILYKNLRESHELLWNIDRVCEDNPLTVESNRISTNKAIDYCEEHQTTDDNPFTAEARCANYLGAEEKGCADPLSLDASSVIALYQNDSDDEKFRVYLKCVWLKWNYVDQNGTVLYANMKHSGGLPWRMGRICEDTPNQIRATRLGFDNALDYCKKHRPAVENPFTVRRCIVNNFKPNY